MEEEVKEAACRSVSLIWVLSWAVMMEEEVKDAACRSVSMISVLSWVVMMEEEVKRPHAGQYPGFGC